VARGQRHTKNYIDINIDVKPTEHRANIRPPSEY
jgi:hypothetical protein